MTQLIESTYLHSLINPCHILFIQPVMNTMSIYSHIITHIKKLKKNYIKCNHVSIIITHIIQQ
jgi:hypothetical protein